MKIPKFFELSGREKAGVAFMACALVILIFRLATSTHNETEVVGQAQTPAQAEQRLERLRHVAAQIPGKEAVLKQLEGDLAIREKGIIQAATAAQAQARLLEIARRLGSAEGIDVRGGDFSPPKELGSEYGVVLAGFSFECPVEKLVNFLAAISHEPEMISTQEIHVTAGNQKSKTVTAHLILAGLVARSLVPEKKGLAAF